MLITAVKIINTSIAFTLLKSVLIGILATAVTVNKNSVPNDPKSPFVTSGIRVGTPAITRRGFKEAEAKELAGWMCDVLDSINDEAVIERIKGKVLDICARYPVYA